MTGWIIGVAVQALWIVYALVSHQYGFIFSALAYGIVNVRNWYRWSESARSDEA